MEHKTQDEAFFEWFEKVEPHISLYTARMIWDIGYAEGKLAGVQETRAIFEETTK